jgi:hypothetical protein
MATRSIRWILQLVIGSVILGGTAWAATDPALIGWWACDEGAGDTVADSSPNHNNGHFYQGDPVWVTGVHGSAVELTKPTLIRIPAVNLTLTAATIAGWIRPYGAQTSWVAILMHRPTAHGFNVLNDFQLAYHWNDDPASWNYRSQARVADNDWSFAALTIQPAKATVYLNGVASGVNAVPHNPAQWTADLFLGGDGSGEFDDRRMVGALDDVSFYSRALIEEEIKSIMLGLPSPALAGSPLPKGGSVDVPRDVILSWQSGQFANTHDVYFGTSAEDVNNASKAAPLGVLASRGQDPNTFDPAGLLAFGQTYYWRVDEVNAPPNESVIFKGRVSSFTTEPYAYPVPSVKATASSQANATMGPEKTVDGSGLTGDEHNTTPQAMWLSKNGSKPIWIRYELDNAYTLHQMWVWNSNQATELTMGYGAKDVTIETSLDGNTWTPLAGTWQFARAAADVHYKANTIVDFKGTLARYVRVNIQSSWGGRTQAGLAEVRFLYVPVKAYGPSPASAAQDVAVDRVLQWRPGREAALHEVRVSTDPNAVLKGTAPVRTMTEHTCPLDGFGVEYGRTYTWRITEVNDARTPKAWDGDLWTFSTPAYLVVDDFESYDNKCNRIYVSWLDGTGCAAIPECGVAVLTGNETGSTVGYRSAPYAERTTVHSGMQSMPLAFNNPTPGSYSEAYRVFYVPRDWSAAGLRALVLWFRGDVNNPPAQLYAKINGHKVTYPGRPEALSTPIWMQWTIDLTSLGEPLRSVKTLTLGVAGQGQGLVTVDDIRLYRVAPAQAQPADPGPANLAACYTMEGNVDDVSGHGYNGTAHGSPAFVDAPAGYGRAIRLTAANSDYVDLPIGPLVATLGSSTITAWVNYSTAGQTWQRVFDFGDSTTSYMFLTTSAAMNGVARFAIRATDSAAESMVTASRAMAPGWHPLAVVIDGATKTVQLYEDGVLVATGPTATLPQDMGATTRNWLGRSQFEADAYFEGELDEFRIYDRALSPGEIRWLAGER